MERLLTNSKTLTREIRSTLNSLTLRRAGVEVGASIRLYGSPIISKHADSSIELGRNVTVCSDARQTALGVSRPTILRTLMPSAVITIGDETGLSGTVICAARAVTVGSRCLIGADVLIADTDFHPIDRIPRRYESLPAPAMEDSVHIGNDVFIGTRSIILKGTRIGDGAVIGAGSLVSGQVPARSVYAGVPARFIRTLNNSGE